VSVYMWTWMWVCGYVGCVNVCTVGYVVCVWKCVYSMGYVYVC